MVKIHIKRKCRFCKKTFDAYIYNIKKGFGKYCSKACSNKANKLGFRKGHPDYRKTDLKIIGLKISKAKKGVNFSEKHKKALSEARKIYYDKIGRKECRNDDGRRKCHKCILWREKIFKRDNYTCQMCGKRGVYLEADHIKSWIKFPKLRHVSSNGRTLCRECHKLTSNYKIKAKNG